MAEKPTKIISEQQADTLLPSEAELTLRGASLVFERMQNPDWVEANGNPVFYRITMPGKHTRVEKIGDEEWGAGDAFIRRDSGTIGVIPEGGMARINNPASDTHWIVPVRVLAQDVRPQNPTNP
jgi:hypothetical protein